MTEFVEMPRPAADHPTLQYACDVVVGLPEDAAVRVLTVMLDTARPKQWDNRMLKLAPA
jgi:hypothetical protein